MYLYFQLFKLAAFDLGHPLYYLFTNVWPQKQVKECVIFTTVSDRIEKFLKFATPLLLTCTRIRGKMN